MDYHIEGFVLGVNFIFTVETKERPLTVQDVRSAIDMIFNMIEK